MNNHSIQNKVCLVTGASQGIGRHFASILAKAGAFVVATSLASEQSKLDALVEEIIHHGGKAIAFDIDLRDYSQFNDKISEIIKQTKRIDILINNAGVSYYAKFFDVTEKDWDAHLDVNLKGAFFLSQAVANHMVNLKIPGNIINIGSIAGNQAKKYALPFCVSKAGLHHLTKIMAFELVEHEIRVNAISLGLFPTELTTDYIASEAGKHFIEQIPKKRPGQFEELDGPLLLLASDASTYMTGSIIEVDGGFAVDIFLREDFEHNKTNKFFKSE
jgi:NAD(P)-dependent dehydrogenase (short-subunit alcohol dehydrogenase family)